MMSSQPAYIWALVLAGVLGIPAVAAVGLYGGGRATGRSRGAAWAVAGGFAAVWAVWIGASAVLADRGAYAQAPGVNRPWIGLAAGGALLVALGGTAIPGIRAAIRTPGGIAGLTWPHTLRVVGVVFIVAMALGTLPAVFALPAGLGDIAVGVAAPFIARRLKRGDHTGAVWFNLLGLIDLVVAVSIGFLAGLGSSRILDVTPSTADVALLPLALIPTAAVPLALALHVVSLMRLRHASSTAPQLLTAAA
jgi:hypothetical protein